MSITGIEIAIDLDKDASPSFLDGKMRISVAADTVSIYVNRDKDGTAYVLAEAPVADFKRALGILGLGAA